MELLMPTGEKTEKTGTLLTDASQIEKKLNSEMLEQIDGKLDLLLSAGKTETDRKSVV